MNWSRSKEKDEDSASWQWTLLFTVQGARMSTGSKTRTLQLFLTRLFPLFSLFCSVHLTSQVSERALCTVQVSQVPQLSVANGLGNLTMYRCSALGRTRALGSAPGVQCTVHSALEKSCLFSGQPSTYSGFEELPTMLEDGPGKSLCWSSPSSSSSLWYPLQPSSPS